MCSCLKKNCTGSPFRSSKPPHKDPASHLIRATSEVSFPHSDSRCWWYIGDLSSFTPRHVGIWVKDGHFLSSVTLSLPPASLFFRWKAGNTVFDQLSLSSQVWRYAANVTRSWLRATSRACQSPAECMNSLLSVYAYFCETYVGKSWV